MLRTRLTNALGLEHPIVSAPMAHHSSGTLAAAVSRAGALGTFGGIHMEHGPEWIHEQVALVRGVTSRPFGIGFITSFLPNFEGHFQAALDVRAPVIALSFGAPAPYVARIKAAGLRAMCQVQTLEHARTAAEAGADFIVAQGNEAGGHTGEMGLLPLLVSTLDALPNVPVLASGGIASARSLAAVLAAGADGVWMGTAFIATHECIDVNDAYKRLIVASNGEDTIVTQAYDVASGMQWPEGIGDRVRRNRFTDEWHGRNAEIVAKRAAIAEELRAAARSFDSERTAVRYGESAGAVKSVRNAGDVVHELSRDAERLLREGVTRLDSQSTTR